MAWTRKVLDVDGRQILVKHGSIYVHCHPCRVALERRLSSEVDIDDTSKKSMVKPARMSSQLDATNVSKDNDSDSDIDADSEPEEISQDEDVANVEFQGSMLMPANNPTNNTNEGAQNLPPNPDISHTTDSVPENQAFAVEPSFTVNHLLKKDMNLRFKRNDKEEWITGKLFSRAGKTTGKYANTWNVQSETGIEPVDFDQDVSTWEEVSIENTLFCAEENCDEFVINTIHQTKIEDDISLAKEKELVSWREQGVYEEVENMGQSCITTRWVLKTKMVNGKETVKARLCARGFQELQDFRIDSPTCSRESVHMLLLS